MRTADQTLLNLPQDFSRFWQAVLARLDKVPPRVQSMGEILDRRGVTFREVGFDSLDGVRIHGSLLEWQDSTSRPLIIYTHGYNSQCSEVYWEWAMAGANVFGFDVRGFGESVMPNTPRSEYGYILTGIESPHRSILVGAISDYIQAGRAAAEFLGSRVSHTTFYGFSFAGALAFMAQALIGEADFLVTGVPTFGCASQRHKLVKRGSGQEINNFLRYHPEMEETVINTLSYFDPVNFAERITCDTLIGLGIDDDIVPAETVYAIINRMKIQPNIRVFPVSHSTAKEEALWKLFEDEWLDEIQKTLQ